MSLSRLRKAHVVLTACLLLFPITMQAQHFHFSCLPYLQDVTDTEATIIWATDRDALSWVEIAPDDGSHFYATERPKFFSTTLGKRDITKQHRVRVSGLKPNTTYRYRVYSTEVTNNENQYTRYGNTIATEVYRKKPLKLRTADPAKRSQHFAVVNDIHEHNDRLARLFAAVDSASLDFMVLNGDMANNMNTLEQSYNGFLSPASGLFASAIPFYMVRGNHETRGTMSQQFMDLYVTPTGLPYYMVRRGDICFIALDGGEDKPDSDIEYNGLADFDRYRSEEAAWLEKAIESEEWQSAPIRMVFLHVPPSPKGWHGQIELFEKLVPVLNRSGVDLMICGHIHRHAFHPAGENGVAFPILANSNKEILDINVGDNSLEVKVLDEKGTITHTMDFKPRH